MRKVGLPAGLWAAFSGLLVTVVMQTFVANSAPALVREWSVSTSGFGWLFASYMLAAGVLIPLSGQLVDRWGGRIVCLLGVTFFALTTLFVSTASGFVPFIIGRVGQGIAAALVGTAALALIADLVPIDQRGRFFGIASGMQASGYLLGPVIGGLLIESFGWRIAFMCLGGFALAVAVLLAVTRAPSVPPRQAHTLDWAGAAWFGILIFAVLLLTKDFASGSNTWMFGTAVGAIGLLAGLCFYRQERRHPHPVVPQALIKLAEYRFSLVACLFIGTMQYSAVAFIPLMVQDVRGGTVLQTAWFSLPMVLGGMAGSVLGGRLGERLSTYTINGIGLSLAALGFFLFSTLLSIKQDWILQCASLTIGIGIAFYYPTQLAVAERLAGERVGSALSLLNTARNVGGALSVSFLTMIMELHRHWQLSNQLTLVFGILACAAVSCLLLNYRLNRLVQPISLTVSQQP